MSKKLVVYFLASGVTANVAKTLSEAAGTSGGSGFGRTADGLKSSVSGTTIIKEGKLLNGKPSKAELNAWVEGLGV